MINRDMFDINAAMIMAARNAKNGRPSLTKKQLKEAKSKKKQKRKKQREARRKNR